MTLKLAFKCLLISIFFLSVSLCAEIQSAWTLISEGRDYRLYKKQSSGSKDLVAFRLVGILKFTPEEVLIGILDRDHRMSWMRDIRELHTIRIPRPGTVIEYSAVKTPFIIKDRDFVIQTEMIVERPKQKYRVLSHSVVEGSVPPGPDVRGELTEGVFIIETGSSPGTAQLTADMDVDPKGSVPLWIVNKFQKGWPVGMFHGLQRFLGTKKATLPDDFKFLLEK